MSVFCCSLINTELKIYEICNNSDQVIVSTHFAFKDETCSMIAEMSC